MRNTASPDRDKVIITQWVLPLVLRLSLGLMQEVSLVVAETVWQMRDEFQPLIDTLVLERKRLAEELAKIPALTVYPSETNFIFGRSAKTQDMVAYLMEKRICIRNFSGDLSDCFRLSVGTSMENDALLREMRAFWERS